MCLSKNLKKWRTKKPDEYIMDQFIKEAMRLELVEEIFTSSNKQNTPCPNCGELATYSLGEVCSFCHCER